MEYKVVLCTSGIHKFNYDINEMLKDGWELYGSPVVLGKSEWQQGKWVKFEGYTSGIVRADVLCQALIKK